MSEMIATRTAYGEFLKSEAAKMDDVVVLDADLAGSTKTSMFKEVAPDRFFDMGIAEQNMMGVAAGLALSGKTVFASSFAMFASGRAFEIVRNSIGYTKANVKICATHAGVTVGPDGASHQTFEDITLMRTIPGMIVVNPCDAVSAKVLLRQVANMNGPAYIRLGRAKVPVLYGDEGEGPSTDSIKLGKGNVISEGKDVTLIATGIMTPKAVNASRALKEFGISAGVIDMHTIKPIDRELLVKVANETGKIVTCEEHGVIGGLGSAVSEVLSEECPVKVKMVGQHDTYGESGEPDELLLKYGMTEEAIVEAAKEIV